MAAPLTLTTWLQGLPITWLVSDTNGRADAAAQGAVYDAQVDLLKQAVEARFPDNAPDDALPHQGGDRKLIQGFTESDDTFRIRLKDPWGEWGLAGTWVELLYQLYFTLGFEAGTAYIVQQNGLAYSLTANPTAGVDPTPLVNIDLLGLNYSITPPTGVPWWTFDTRNDLCSRFAIIVGPGAMPPSLQPRCRATFAGTSQAVATWTWPWDITNYGLISGPPVTTGAIPLISVDASLNTFTDITVNASAAFTGTVDFVGYRPGGNAMVGPSESTQNLVKQLANTWKPAKAKYMGTYALVTGNAWGWPSTLAWGAAGLKWGDSLVQYFAP